MPSFLLHLTSLLLHNLPLHLSISPSLHLSQLACLTFSHLVFYVILYIVISLTSLCLTSPFYLAVTFLHALILHHLFLLSHQCCLSSQFSLLLSLPPLSYLFLNLTHRTSNHPAKRALFLLHAVPHHGVQCVPNSLISLESLYLPVQCLSLVSGNCMKQTKQVVIGTDYILDIPI